jgi:predicted SAM-dependent methyltransferase
VSRRINIGCGPYKMAGFVNIDRNPRLSPDIVRDVTRGLPFDDDSVEVVHASHFLEHLTCDDMMFVIEECYRVLIAQGRLEIRVPLRDLTSLDHLQIFDEKSFDPLALPEVADYYQRTFRWAVIEKKVFPDRRSGCDNLDMVFEALK